MNLLNYLEPFDIVNIAIFSSATLITIIFIILSKLEERRIEKELKHKIKIYEKSPKDV